MNSYRVSLAICALFAVACSDSEEKGALTTGTFAGNVNQLRYSTKTQSGITDAAGTFSYRVGETVTFSVGGSTLGTTVGAEVVTVFDLFGAAAPTDGVRILHELDEPTGLHRPYFRALDVWSFLMGLDADGDARNGIDLTGRDAQLANVHVGFDWEPGDLDAQLMIAARVPNYAMRPDGLDAVFATLYPAIGLAVTGDAANQITSSMPGALIALTYDANAQAKRSEYRNAGVVEGGADFVHDSALRLLSVEFFSEPDGAGGFKNHQTSAYTYGPTGVYTGSTLSFQVAPAAAEVVSRTTLDYDASGRLTTFVTSRDSVSRTTFAFDESANTVTTLYEYRATAGAPVTSRARTRYTYDVRGNVVEQVYDNDNSGAGYTSTSTTTSTFDAKDRPISEAITLADATGAVTRVYAQTYGYDGDALVNDTETSSPPGAPTEFTYVTTYTYDDGRLTRRTSTKQTGDGPALMTSDLQQTFDVSGHVLVSDEKYFDDGGALDSEDVTTLTYDARGNVATSVRELGVGTPISLAYGYTSTGNGVVAGLQVPLLLGGGF